MKKDAVSVVSTGEWVLTYLITLIPLIGFLMLFVWAFGDSNTNPNKAKWAKAMLILIALFTGSCGALVLSFGPGMLPFWR